MVYAHRTGRFGRTYLGGAHNLIGWWSPDRPVHR